MARWRDLSLSIAVLLVYLSTGYGDDPLVVISSTTPAINKVDNILKCPKDRDAYLTCAVTNKPKDREVKWVMLPKGNASAILKPIGTDLNSQDQFKYSLEKPSPTEWRLKIQNVQVTDEGRYICRVQTVSQSYIDAVTDIKVTEVPLISDLQTSSNMAVKEGESVTLRCNATGRPFPVVSWQRFSGELLPSGGVEMKDYLLRIPFARPEHAGYYKCNAQNLAGFDSRSIHLQVKFAPKVTVASENVYQALGYYKDIICDVEGYPQPSVESVTWSHSNHDIYSDWRFEVLTISGAYNRIRSILTIKGVERLDYGIYRCAASNDQGDGEARAELKASDSPTPDRAGEIRNKWGEVINGGSILMISFTTVIMVSFTCLLHSGSW